jgi:hypothetical protein
MLDAEQRGATGQVVAVQPPPLPLEERSEAMSPAPSTMLNAANQPRLPSRFALTNAVRLLSSAAGGLRTNPRFADAIFRKPNPLNHLK